MLFVIFLCLLYLMVHSSGYTISKSTNNENIKEVSNFVNLDNIKYHGAIHQRHNREDKSTTQHYVTKSTKMYVEPFTSATTTVKPTTAQLIHKSSKRKIIDFWRKCKGKKEGIKQAKKEDKRKNKDIQQNAGQIATKDKQHRATNKKEREWRSQITKKEKISIDSTTQRHNVLNNVKNKRNIYFLRRQAATLKRDIKTKPTTKKIKAISSIRVDITPQAIAITKPTTKKHMKPVKTKPMDDIKKIISSISPQLANLKKKYKFNSYGTVSPSCAYNKLPSKTKLTTATATDTASEEFLKTAQIEDLLNSIKFKTIQMIEESNSYLNNMIIYSPTQRYITVDPFLIQLPSTPSAQPINNLVAINDGNKSGDKRKLCNDRALNKSVLIGQDRHHLVARSLKANTIAVAQNARDKIKNIIRKMKSKVSGSCKKSDSNKTTTKILNKKKTQVIKTSKTHITTKTTKLKTKNTTPIDSSRLTRDSTPKHTTSAIKSRSLPTFDDTVMPLYEDMLKNTQQEIASQKKTSKLPLKKKEKRHHGLFKRNHDVSMELNPNDIMYEEVPLPDEYLEPGSLMSPDSFNTTLYPIEGTGYRRLSDKIAYSDFVNGYKHYLQFQKDLGKDKFSAMVKYQAHKHHKVDDIGKFILDKIPPVSTYRPFNKQHRKRSFFDDTDIDDQEISTKTDESWFKKHFYLFIDNGPPKKFHTSETVPLKSPLTEKPYSENKKPKKTGHSEKDHFYIQFGGNESSDITNDDKDSEKSLEELANTLEGTKAKKLLTPHSRGKLFGKKYRRTPTHDSEDTVKDSYDETKSTDVVTKYESGDTSILAKSTVADTSSHHKEKDNQKYGYVDINLLVPKEAAAVKLRENTTNKSKFKEFFRNIHFKKSKSNNKSKRSCNPFKKLKDIFKQKTIPTKPIIPMDKNNRIPNFSNTKIPMSIVQNQTDSFTDKGNRINTFKTTKFDKNLSINDISKLIPNISDISGDNVSWSPTKPLSKYKSHIEDSQSSILFNPSKKIEEVMFAKPTSTTYSIGPGFDEDSWTPTTPMPGYNSDSEDTQVPFVLKPSKKDEEDVMFAKLSSSTFSTAPDTIPDSTNENTDEALDFEKSIESLIVSQSRGDKGVFEVSVEKISKALDRTEKHNPVGEEYNNLQHNIGINNALNKNIGEKRERAAQKTTPATINRSVTRGDDKKELIDKTKVMRRTKIPRIHLNELNQRLRHRFSMDNDVSDILENAENDKYLPEIKYDEQAYTKLPEVNIDKIMSKVDATSTEPYNNPDFFNDLINWHGDILHSDKVQSTSWRNIVKDVDQVLERSLSTPSVHKMLSDLKKLSMVTEQNLNMSFIPTVTIKHMYTDNQNNNEARINNLALNDRPMLTSKNFAIKEQADYYRIGQPLDTDSIKVSTRSKEGSRFESLPDSEHVTRLINRGIPVPRDKYFIPRDWVNKVVTVTRLPEGSSLASQRHINTFHLPLVTVTVVSDQQSSNLRTNIDADWISPADFHVMKGVRRGYSKETPTPGSNPPLMIDTALLSYDAEVDNVGKGIQLKKFSRNSLKPWPVQVSSFVTHDNLMTKFNKQPPQYYTTPLPMKSKDFDKFLQEQGIDVKSLTEPLGQTTSKDISSARLTTKKKDNFISLLNITRLDKNFKIKSDNTKVLYANSSTKKPFFIEFNDRYKRSIQNSDVGDSLDKINHDRLKKKLNLFEKMLHNIEDYETVAPTISYIDDMSIAISNLHEKANELPVIDPSDLTKPGNVATRNVIPVLEDNINTERSDVFVNSHLVNAFTGPAVHNRLLYNDKMNHNTIGTSKINLPMSGQLLEPLSKNLFNSEENMQKIHSKHPKRVQISSHHYKYDIFYDNDASGKFRVANKRGTHPLLKVGKTFMKHPKFSDIAIPTYSKVYRRMSKTAKKLDANTDREPRISISRRRFVRNANVTEKSSPVIAEVNSSSMISENITPSRQKDKFEKYTPPPEIKEPHTKYTQKPCQEETGFVIKVERGNCATKKLNSFKQPVTFSIGDQRYIYSRTLMPEKNVKSLDTSQMGSLSILKMLKPEDSTRKPRFIYVVPNTANSQKMYRYKNNTKYSDNVFENKIQTDKETSDIQKQISPYKNTHLDKKRDIQNQEVYTAKDVAALEVIVDLMKNTLSYEEKDIGSAFSNNLMLGQPMKSIHQSQDSTNSIQVHIAIPYDIQPGKKRSALDPMRVRKVFSAKMLTPVDLEYQVHSFEATPETTTAITSITTDDGLSPGMYLLIDKPNNGYALKPVKAKIDLSNVRYRQVTTTAPSNKQQETTRRDNIKDIGKVTLSKNLISAINKQLVELYENFTTARAADIRVRRKRRVHLTPNFHFRKRTPVTTDTTKFLVDSRYRIRRVIDWEALKNCFRGDRVCNCKCKPYKPMCRACAASDAVMNELIFEFNNIEQYMKDHCTELQTYFWMNPHGGLQLRDTVHNIDKTLNDYYKRVRGKCQGKTCKAFGIGIDKREFIKSTLVPKERDGKQVTTDLASLADDLNRTVNMSTCFNRRLSEEGGKMIHAINICIFPKIFGKRSDVLTTKKKLIKNVYSLDNINVNIICHPDAQTRETVTTTTAVTPQSSTTTASTTSTTSASTTTSTCTPSNNMIPTSTPTTNAHPNQIITSQKPQEQENLFEFDFDDENEKPKKRKGFKYLFPRRNKKDKLFTYYTINHNTTPKPLFKRDTYSQIEIPLISDTGGNFWFNYLHSSSMDEVMSTRQVKQQETSLKHKPGLTRKESTITTSKNEMKNVTTKHNLTRVSDTKKSETMKTKNKDGKKLTTQKFMNVSDISIQINSSRDIQRESESEIDTEYFPDDINQLLKLFGNSVQDIETVNRNSNRSTPFLEFTSKKSDKVTEKPNAVTKAMQKSESSTNTQSMKKNTPSKRTTEHKRQKSSKSTKTIPRRKTTTTPISIEDMEKEVSAVFTSKVTGFSKKTTAKSHMKTLKKQTATTSKTITHRSATTVLKDHKTLSPSTNVNSATKNMNSTPLTTTQQSIKDSDNTNSPVLGNEKINNENSSDSTSVTPLEEKKITKQISRKIQRHGLLGHFKSVTLKFLGLTKRKFKSTTEIEQHTSSKAALIDSISNIETKPITPGYFTEMPSRQNPAMAVINENNKLTRNILGQGTKNSDYRNLLLSIIQYESNKLNDEWQKIAYNSEMNTDDVHKDSNTQRPLQKCEPLSGDLFKDNDRKTAWPTKSPQDDKIDIMQDVKSIPDLEIPEPTETDEFDFTKSAKKPPGLLDKIASKMGMKVVSIDENMEKAAKQSYSSEATLKANRTNLGQKEKNINTREASDSYQANKFVCDLQATYNHVAQLHNELVQKEFEAFVKNIPCYKYKRMRRNFFINHRTGGLKWDWIRNKRSLNHRLKHRTGGNAWHEENEDSKQYCDIFETFVRDSDGIYRVGSRRKRSTDENNKDDSLKTLPPLLPITNDVYFILDDSIALECLPYHERISANPQSQYTWDAERRDMLDQDNVQVDGSNLLIRKAGPRNSGTYSCSVDDVVRRTVRVSVVTLPSINIVFVAAYKLPRECTYHDLKAIQLLAREMSKEISCGKVCSIRIDEPVCQLDRATNRSLVRSTTVLTVNPKKMGCSVQCRRDLHSSMVRLSASNVPALKTTNVILSRDGVNETLTPCKDVGNPTVTRTLRKKDSSGHHEYHKLSSVLDTDKMNLVIVCDAGYYLMQDQNICGPCPSNTSSSVGENSCTPCPEGTRSDPGARECRKHIKRHRRYDWWWYPPCGYLVASAAVACACGLCMLLSLVVQLASRHGQLPDRTNSAARRRDATKKTSTICGHMQYSAKTRPLSPSRVILARFFKPSLTSSRATAVDSQETRFELWKERNIPPPLPPVDFDLETT